LLTGKSRQANILVIMTDKKPDRKHTVMTDGRITLRPYSMKDAGAVFHAIKDSIAEISPWLPFAHEGYSIKETRDFLKRRPGEWKKGLTYDFGIFEAGDGTLLGGCGLNQVSKLNDSANLGYWVRTSRAGQGIATAATLLLAKWGFETLKLTRIEILVATGNARSLRVAEKAGAKREGVLRNRLKINDNLSDAVMHSLVPGDIPG
jgi:ribosomal-protein-serine acetyltransferase